MGKAKVQYRRLMKLEAFRGVAALYIVVHHYVHYSPELAFMSKFFVFGQFALMVFFLLSGFVIYYATVYRDPDLSFREYILRRIKRIFPAFLLVLGFTYLMMSLTQGKWADPHLDQLIGNILQLQDKHPYSFIKPYFGNSPLWSLAYEWWYYMIFWAIYATLKHNFVYQRMAAIGVTVLGFVTFIIYPNAASMYASYFMLWWAGLEMAREWTMTGKITLKEQIGIWAVIFAMGIAWGANAWLFYKNGGPVVFSDYPFVQARHFLSVNFILAVAFIWYKLRWFLFNELFSHFEPLAGISYGIYIFHYPIVIYMVTHRPTGNVWLDLAIIIPVILGISWLVEKPYQKFFNRLIKVKKRPMPVKAE